MSSWAPHMANWESGERWAHQPIRGRDDRLLTNQKPALHGSAWPMMWAVAPSGQQAGVVTPEYMCTQQYQHGVSPALIDNHGLRRLSRHDPGSMSDSEEERNVRGETRRQGPSVHQTRVTTLPLLWILQPSKCQCSEPGRPMRAWRLKGRFISDHLS